VELFTITLPITRYLREPNLASGQIGPIIQDPTAAQIAGAEAQAKKTANEIIAKLKAGADFARLAEDYHSSDDASNNGGRVEVNRGSMQDGKFEDFVFSVPARTIGQPYVVHDADFRNSYVVVVKIGEKHDARTVGFGEAQKTLMTELKEKQFGDLEAQEMDKLSRSGAVEAVDRMIDVALDGCVTRYATK
jgi:hypothetical protein